MKTKTITILATEWFIFICVNYIFQRSHMVSPFYLLVFACANFLLIAISYVKKNYRRF